jgi:hypothetical protein
MPSPTRLFAATLFNASLFAAPLFETGTTVPVGRLVALYPTQLVLTDYRTAVSLTS